MTTWIKILVITLVQIVFALILAFVGWTMADDLNLSYDSWFAIAFVGSLIVRTGILIEELDEDLTKRL